MSNRQKRRRAAVKAAATVFAAGNYSTTEELWSLVVFFDRYIEKGAAGTMEDFGPVPEAPAAILKMVPKND